MSSGFSVGAGVLSILFAAGPLLLVIIASVVTLVSRPRTGTVLICVGAFVLAALSFSFVLHFFLARFYDASDMASVLISLNVVLAGVKAFALTVICVGLIMLAIEDNEQNGDGSRLS